MASQIAVLYRETRRDGSGSARGSNGFPNHRQSEISPNAWCVTETR